MKIMVGYDGSNVAKDALELAKKYAKTLKATICVVTSMETGTDIPREKFEKAENELHDAKASVRKEDIACDTHLSETGMETGENLVQFAQENKVDMIFIGVRRRSKVGKLIFGSTAQYVILNAPCPVVSVK